MHQVLSLKAAERKAFQLSNSQDGLYDVFLGTFIVALSSLGWMDENGLRTPWNVIAIEAISLIILLGVLATKKFVVAPRVGQVRYGPDRKKRFRQSAILLGIIFVLTVGLVALTLRANLRGPIFDGAIGWGLKFDIVHAGAGLFMWAIFSFIGWIKDFPRMILYGGMFGSGYFVSTLLQDQNGGLFQWPLAVAGLIVTVVGLVIFIRFFEKYPLPDFGELGEQ
jgi:hypothetical protein